MSVHNVQNDVLFNYGTLTACNIGHPGPSLIGRSCLRYGSGIVTKMHARQPCEDDDSQGNRIQCCTSTQCVVQRSGLFSSDNMYSQHCMELSMKEEISLPNGRHGQNETRTGASKPVYVCYSACNGIQPGEANQLEGYVDRETTYIFPICSGDTPALATF